MTLSPEETEITFSGEHYLQFYRRRLDQTILEETIDHQN